MLDNLQHYADQLTSKHNIPAVSVAVWKDGKLSKAASGILNLDTGVEATTDSIFQIGSITKVFTSSLIMKLVESGRVELDKPIKQYLRDFQVADRQATETITVQQLLNHSNGIAGDYFVDDEKHEGPHLARFIDRCSQLPLVHPVGDGFSYSNVAFAIAGRLVEVVLGISWFDAMEELIYQPLAMKQAICRPADVIRFRAALGHLGSTDSADDVFTCSGKYLCLGQAPAGTTPTMTASELITFGRAHMEGGLGQNNERWLTEESVRLMQTATVAIPVTSDVVTGSMGLGWMLSQHNATGQRFVSHSGATNGQCAMLRIFPEQQACFALLFNRCKSDALIATCNELTQAVAGIDLAASTSNQAMQLNHEALQCYVGRYHSYAGDYEFTLTESGLMGTFDDAVDEEERLTVRLKPLGDHRFEQINAQNASLGIMRFMNVHSGGQATRLFSGLRLYERVVG